MLDLLMARRATGTLHVCALFDSAEEAAAVAPALACAALQESEKFVALAGTASLERLRGHLQEMAISATESESVGQLTLVPWRRVAGDPRHRFDCGKALSAVDSILSGATQDGVGGVRVVAEMDWVVSALGGGMEVAGYERDVDGVMARYRQPAICVYDLNGLSGQLLIEILAAHPMAYVGGSLVRSPFYREQA
jgi:hypothetical protein